MVRRVRPARVSSSSVSGTNATSDTSLVITMEQKKHSSVSSSTKARCVPAFFSSACDRRSISPARVSPATAAIRQNSSPSTRQSIYDKYAADGGAKQQETAAHSAEMHSTGSFLMKRTTFCRMAIKPPKTGLKPNAC